MDSAITRSQSYINAGADALFPEALITKEEFLRFKNELDTPILANMTEFGKTPYYSANEFTSFGFAMVIYPVTSLRAAAKAYENVFQEIYDKGSQKEKLDKMQTRKELYEAIQYHEYENLDKGIAKTFSEKYHE